MSMNDVERCVDGFERQLDWFNDHLRATVKVLNDHHDQVNPLWQDDMRKEYDAQWLPLEEAMQHYENVVGPEYIVRLKDTLKDIRGYLYG